jgi:8-oxo-dGTP diphosphatase
MARTPVQAAGGIVLRQAKPPLIAVVRLRKRNEWVLPKGKLDDGETPREAAEREVNEETGHDVLVHEFLGTLVYESSGRSKIVHYWRMQADGEQVYELMTDIREVDWLPLEVALTRLSRASERAFLEHVGPVAVAATLADLSKRKAKATPTTKAASTAKAAPATKVALPSKAASTTKAAPTQKRRPRTPAPVPPPPAATVPVPAAEPAPALTELPVVTASEVVESPGAAETPGPLLPVETQAPVPVDQSEPVPSADSEEAREVVVLDREASACENDVVVVAEIDSAAVVETTQQRDSVPVELPETDTVEPRRKTLAQKLRTWLGSVA